MDDIFYIIKNNITINEIKTIFKYCLKSNNLISYSVEKIDFDKSFTRQRSKISPEIIIDNIKNTNFFRIIGRKHEYIKDKEYYNIIEISIRNIKLVNDKNEYFLYMWCNKNILNFLNFYLEK